MNQINDWVKQLLGTWAQKRVAKNGSFLGCIMKELFREMPITTTRELDSYDREDNISNDQTKVDVRGASLQCLIWIWKSLQAEGVPAMKI